MAAKGDRVVLGMTKLAREIAKAVGENSVQRKADEWDVPYWVIRDTMSGRIQCPRPIYLPRIARGLKATTDTVIEWAHEPDEVPVPA